MVIPENVDSIPLSQQVIFLDLINVICAWKGACEFPDLDFDNFTTALKIDNVPVVKRIIPDHVLPAYNKAFS